MTRRTFATVTATLATAVAATGCNEEQASVLDRAIAQDVRSGNLTVDVRFAGAGQAGGVRMTGPFAGDDDAHVGRFDWTTTIDVPGQQPLRGEVISDGRDVFVRYGGSLYHVGAKRIAQFERRSAQQARRGPRVKNLGDLQRLGLDVKAWFPQSDGPQDSTFAGEPTRRVTGRLDVSAALRDLVKLLRHPGIRAQLGGGPAGAGGANALGQLSDDQIAKIDKAITDPRFEVQVGRGDGKLRRIDGALGFAGAGRMTFDVQLRDVDRPVTIAAPHGGQPIKRLLQRLAHRGAAGRAAASPARAAHTG